MNSPRHGDILADGVVEMLRTRGPDAVTLRALASWMKVTPSALSHRAGCAESVVLVVEALGGRWATWSIAAVDRGGVPALPRTMLERHGVRVWVLAREMALTEAAEGRREALDRWHWYVEQEDAHVHAWWCSRHGDDGYGGFRAQLDGARLALAFDPSLRLAEVMSSFPLLTMC